MKLGSSTLVLLAGTLLLAACGGDGGGGGPGTGTQDGGEYRAVLQSPNGVEGAAAFELTGPGIQTVTQSVGRLFTQSNGTTTRIVVVQEPAGPISFKVTMAAGQGPPSARVVEVVDGNDLPRTSLSGYNVVFGR
jgi:ABC-type glycerol-3-phosphate transport system substrate-binding protein